ncbi:MAG: ATP-binding cassette domain-containing protein [Mycobacteriales bacterium]
MRIPLRARPSATEAAADVDALAPAVTPVADVTGQPPFTGPLLACRGVDVAYDKVQVLFEVDLEVAEGEIVALLGTNGAGKSTLLKAISGLVHPTAGSIHFGGHDLTHASPGKITEFGIVHVPGGRAVFPTLTVAEHFTAGRWLYARQDSEDVAARSAHVLEMFPRLGERWGQLAGDLSGGEQQQLALGMAFVARPRLLVIDELSLGLAPAIVDRLLESVREIHAEGATVVLVEQSVNVALKLANRAYFMEKGEVRFTGPTEELLSRDDVLRSVFVGHAAHSLGTSSTRTAAEVKEATAKAVRSGEPVLAVDGLTRDFGGIVAVSDVSLALYDGQILGLIGPNGAGKTTVFDLISGHLPVRRGRITLDGQDITNWPPERRAAAGLGRSFQDARLFPSLTVAENIALGLERHVEVRDHASALLGTSAMRESELDVAFTVDDLVELMGLGAFRDKFVAELSTGSRRIVDLAMVISHDPKVLLLDEPSSGIAQRETEALGPLLRRIRDETGCAMLVIEHDMPLISALSDSIAALDMGRVLLEGPPHTVLDDDRVIAAYLGSNPAALSRSGAGSKNSSNGRRQKVEVP